MFRMEFYRYDGSEILNYEFICIYIHDEPASVLRNQTKLSLSQKLKYWFESGLKSLNTHTHILIISNSNLSLN